MASKNLQADLTGRIEVWSPFDLLQLCCQLRKYGRIQLVREDGWTASCTLVEGGIATAECGHLTHREAVLTFLWWTKGWFAFEADAKATCAETPIRIPELVMDAVRLADEIERRGADVPERSERLRLADDAASPDDTLECDAGQLFAFLKDHPGLTRAELEHAVPLSPVKVRLGLALLVAAGLLADRAPAVHRLVPSRSRQGSWWQRLTERFPGGLRTLVGYVPDALNDSLYRAVSQLAETLELPTPAFGLSGDGPSFVRLRPHTGGILSLTFLPVVRKNRYLFESFVPSVQLVLMCGGAMASREGTEWVRDLPEGLRLVTLDCNAKLEIQILSTLQSLAEVRP